MAILTLEAIGPKAEELALAAGKAADLPVGYDPEFECATYDSETLGADELQATVFDALTSSDPDWRSQLRVGE